jgi:CBS domain-containing protein
MTVAALLRQKGAEVISVSPASTLMEVATLISSRRIGAVVVMSGERRLEGIVSERDVVKAIAARGDAALRLTAADVMTTDVITATPRTTINEAMEMMDAGYFRHLPVMEGGEMIGIISVRDAVRSHIQSQEQEVSSLMDYVHRGAKADGLR